MLQLIHVFSKQFKSLNGYQKIPFAAAKKIADSKVVLVSRKDSESNLGNFMTDAMVQWVGKFSMS